MDITLWPLKTRAISFHQGLAEPFRQARVALTAFCMEMPGRTDWTVLASVKTKDPRKLPVVLSREEVAKIPGHVR
jgi:hypothetical protein